MLGSLKKIWRKGAMSYQIATNGRLGELRIVRTSFGAFTILLDGTPLDRQLRIPKIFFRGEALILPDGSTVRVSPSWVMGGWSVERNGEKLSAVSHKPVVAQTALILIIALAAGFGGWYWVWQHDLPEWKKPNPPTWALFDTSGEKGETRWLINTKNLRKDEASGSVEAIIRTQGAYATNEFQTPVLPSDYTMVHKFTCAPGKSGYDDLDIAFSSDLLTGKQVSEALPSDAELRRAVTSASFSKIEPGSVMEDARAAACSLAGYRSAADIYPPEVPSESTAFLRTQEKGQ